ncbi:MAG: hypothetical protein WCV99_09405 [Sterolibacterium sp.]|jgi:hypothetical protein
MNSIPAVQSSANLYRALAAQSRPNTASVASSGDSAARSTVNISAAAREAAKSDGGVQPGIKVPDFIANWFSKDFPPDVLDEAKARLDDIKTHGGISANGPSNLPLLPENQKLLDDFHHEMDGIRAAGLQHATPAQSERFNLLMNLSMRLQLSGWEKPMNEADVQRQLDVSIAMAKLSIDDPALAPAADSAQMPDWSAGGPDPAVVPAAWRERWEREGLAMPKDVALSPDRSMWLDVAQAAGIGQDEFLAKARDLAGSLKGNALTRAVEEFISGRYLASLPDAPTQA